MYDVYRAMRRAQRHDTQGSDRKMIYFALALAGLGGSAIFWWGVQSQLTENKPIAVAYTALLVLAPPFLTSFLIPWSPGGMLIQKLHSRTWGYAAVFGAALYYLYYSFQLMLSWWSAQPVVADSNMIYQQVLVGLLGFTLIPALLWTPVSDDQITESVKQAQLVKTIQMQTRADIAILQGELLRAQLTAAAGYVSLLGEERAEIVENLRGVLMSVDRTLQLFAGNLNHASQAVFGPAASRAFSAPPLADDFQDVLDYVAREVGATRLIEAEQLDEPQQHTRSDRPSSAGEQTIVSQPSAAPAASRRESPRYAAEYESALAHFGRSTWSAAMLAGHLGKHERTARDRINAWEVQELIGREAGAKASYYFLEG